MWFVGVWFFREDSFDGPISYAIMNDFAAGLQTLARFGHVLAKL